MAQSALFKIMISTAPFKIFCVTSLGCNPDKCHTIGPDRMTARGVGHKENDRKL